MAAADGSCPAVGGLEQDVSVNEPEAPDRSAPVVARWQDWSSDLLGRLRIAAETSADVEVVTPGAAVSPLAYGAAAACMEEMVSLEPRQGRDSGSIREVEVAIAIDHALLARGVPQRVVVGQSLLSRDDVPGLRALVAAGQSPRYHPEVPLRVLVCDRSVAFLALDPRVTRVGAYVVRVPSLIDEAHALFQDVWDHSGRAHMSMPEDAEGVEDLKAEVLRLLCAGLKDDAIARRLGLSDRTVRRVIAQLLEDYNVTSRFQLALVAGENRSLPGPGSRPGGDHDRSGTSGASSSG